MSDKTDLTINPSTKRLLDAFVSRPAHGLLLSGQHGVGLKTISLSLARLIDAHVTIHEVNPDEKGTISIDTVRGLYKLTRSHRDTALVVILDDADAMGREAQNALLKLLEEPVERVYFILTSHQPQLLLSTIRSRLRSIEVLPTPPNLTEGLIEPSTPPDRRAQLRFLAAGLPAELRRMQEDENYLLKNIQLMKDARVFAAGDTYSRLIVVNQYAGDRKKALELLASLNKLLSFMLFSRQQPSLAETLERIEIFRERIVQNAHVKTQLAALTMNFSSGTIGR